MFHRCVEITLYTKTLNKPRDPLSSEKCQLVTLSPAWPVIHIFRAQQVRMGTHITQQADSRTDGRNPEKKHLKCIKPSEY